MKLHLTKQQRSRAWWDQEDWVLEPPCMGRLQQHWQQHTSKISKRHAARLIRGRFQLLPDRQSKETTKLRPKYQITVKGCSMELQVRESAWRAAAFGSVFGAARIIYYCILQLQNHCASVTITELNWASLQEQWNPRDLLLSCLTSNSVTTQKWESLLKGISNRQLWEIKSDWQHQSCLTTTTWKAQKQYSPPIQKNLIRAKGYQQSSLQLSRSKKASPSISQHQAQMRKTEKTVNSGTSNVVRQARKNCWNS